MKIFDFFKNFGKPKKKADVRITIKTLIGNTIPKKIARFDAFQETDESYNIVLVSSNREFKEDKSIAKNQVITFLQHRLNLNEFSYKEKILKIDEKIKEQENRITSIDNGRIITKSEDGKKIEEKVNIIDENNFLTTLKTVKYTIENEGDGSYDEFDLDGTRELTFLAEDGILTPYFYRSPSTNGIKLVAYPDIATKRKHRKSEQEIINEEYLRGKEKDGEKKLTRLLLLALMVLIGINIFWGIQNQTNSMKIGESSEGGASLCAYTLSQQVKYNDFLMKKAIDLLNGTNITTPKSQTLFDQAGNVIGIKI